MMLRSADKAAQRAEHEACWHPWFAWKPVQLLSGDVVWLERVLRRRRTPAQAHAERLARRRERGLPASPFMPKPQPWQVPCEYTRGRVVD